MSAIAVSGPRPVLSNQNGPHPRLPMLLRRHAATTVTPPMAAHTRGAVDAVAAALREAPRPLLLDSGCGTSEAALGLAQARPDALVVGIDRSAARLARAAAAAATRPNLLLLRADLAGFWRGLHAAGIRLAEHYLLYPNPWPKQHQLARRWHGHAVLPVLLALGGRFELRTNWHVYAEEFALALETLGGVRAKPETFAATAPQTAFERKYARAGHELYRVRATLDQRTVLCA